MKIFSHDNVQYLIALKSRARSFATFLPMMSCALEIENFVPVGLRLLQPDLVSIELLY